MNAAMLVGLVLAIIGPIGVLIAIRPCGRHTHRAIAGHRVHVRLGGHR